MAENFMSLQPRTYHPSIEPLEDRTLPAATIQATLMGSNLVIEGTPGNDYLSVTQSSGRISVYGANIAVGTQRVGSVDANAVTRVVMHGLEGNDILIASTVTKPTYITGGSGHD